MTGRGEMDLANGVTRAHTCRGRGVMAGDDYGLAGTGRSRFGFVWFGGGGGGRGGGDKEDALVDRVVCRMR